MIVSALAWHGELSCFAFKIFVAFCLLLHTAGLWLMPFFSCWSPAASWLNGLAPLDTKPQLCWVFGFLTSRHIPIAVVRCLIGPDIHVICFALSNFFSFFYDRGESDDRGESGGVGMGCIQI